MAKCNACGKFMSAATDGANVICLQCKKGSHRACVNIPQGVPVSSSWRCPDCKAKEPRNNQEGTPVRGVCSAYAQDESAVDIANTTDMDSTAEFQEVSLALEVRNLHTEIRQMREEFRDLRGLAAEVRLMREEFQDLRKETRTVQTANVAQMEKLEERVVAMENLVTEAVNEDSTQGLFKALEARVEFLKSELNDRDQELLANDLEIAGIPEEGGENAMHLVLACGKVLGAPLDERDIVSCARAGPVRALTEGAPPRPRPIVVRLARRVARDDMLTAARLRRSFTTEGMGLRSEPRRVYVNERLTRTNRQLFHQAREAGRRDGWRFIWTRDGRIYARRDNGMASHRIKVVADLEKVFGGVPISSH